MAIKIAGTTVIDDSRNADVVNLTLGGTALTATATELNYVDGVTSPIQDQIDNANTKGTLTKSFTSGETSTIALSQAITAGAPVVSVTKEVPQTGVTENAWDVGTTGANYTRHDTAYDTTLTPVAVGFGDIDGASYDSVSFSAASQDTIPLGLAFNNDGTKMYIVGADNDSVFQYSLSTAFDLSTASYDSVSFSVASQDTIPSRLAFSNDGTKMYIVGADNDIVFQYSLSTAFDLNTASYDNISFDASSEDVSPQGLTFNNDGTRMFLVGGSSDSVYQYSLSTAFDLSTASYDSVSFSVSGQDAGPVDIAFNNDGTKMYILGNTDNSVYQYSLSTAFDLSTASYDSVSFSVGVQDESPRGLEFNNDGTKMYIVGNNSDSVHQYTIPLSEVLTLGTGSFASTDVGKTIEGNGGEAILTATDGSYSLVTAFNDSSTIAAGDWSMYGTVFDATNGLELSGLVDVYNISDASYDSVSFDVSSEDTSPYNITFNNNGTKMYILGYTNDSVFQYSLSTAFDLSTASYDSVSFSVASEDTQPRGIAFNNDGTKMYMVGTANGSVYQYSLSTAFDLSTASYDSVSFSVSSQDTNPYNTAFNSDGTKMYILGNGTDSVYQYSLSTAFDLSTASYDSVSFSVVSQDNLPSGIAFNSDGTKMYIVGSGNDSVYQYSLSTAFDLSTASYDSVSFSVASEDTGPQGLTFNNDGTKMYIIGTSSDSVHQYTTGAGIYRLTAQYSPAITNAQGQIDSTYWTDINSMTADQIAGDGQVYYAVSTDGRTTWSVIDNTNGVRPIVRDNAGTWEVNDDSAYTGTTWVAAAVNTELDALQEALATAGEFTVGFDIAGASYDSVSFSVAGQDAGGRSLHLNSDGTKMYLLGGSTDTIYQYNLSTAFDLSTASYNGVSFDISSQDTNPEGLTFNNDGTKMYLLGNGNDSVYQYSLSTTFDLNTASYDSVSFSVASEDSLPKNIVFDNEGTKMFIVGDATNSVYQYSLSTAFDLSTASYDNISFDVSSEDTQTDGIAFNSDGTKMYIVGNSNDSVYQYSLSTAFDLSTASYDNISFSVASEFTNPHDITFYNDGVKMYILNGDVYQYTTGGTTSQNRMDKTQLEAVTDANHYTLGDSLDLMIALYLGSGSESIPSSDGVSINYDGQVRNEGAILGTDYDFDFPANDVVRITSNATQNLKVRVV